MNFEQRHFIITGGSSGIGRATANLLARQGAHLTIIARTPARLEAAQAEIESHRRNPAQGVAAIAADVTDRNQTTQAIAAAVARNGPPEGLIACAGLAQPGYFRELPVEIFEKTMAVNYFGTLYSIKAVLPYLEERGRGSIVLISSGAGLVGLFGYTPYSPAKFAVRGLAESLRAELKPRGVHVALVYPPDTDTPQLQAENQTKPPETRLITGAARMLSADQVAQAIAQGLRQKRWLIAPGLEMTALTRLHSLLQPVLHWYFDRLAAKAHSKI